MANKMELENLNCPQFVDFTSREAFNIHDGADFCFDLGIVGELTDLGPFSSLKVSDQPVKITCNEPTCILKDSTNCSAKPIKSVKPSYAKPPKATKSESEPKNNINKELIRKPQQIKENLRSKLVENISQKKIDDIRVIRAPQLDIKRTRTFSKNETIILDVPAKNTRQSRSRNSTSNKNPNLLSRPNSSEKNKVPLPMYYGIKFVPKINPQNAKLSIDNLSAKSKSRSDSLNRFCNRYVNTTPKKNISLNGSNMRSSSGAGLLNTELRAYKRMEYDRMKKEKERLASMIKNELETSRTQIEKDEIKKLRSNSIIRSTPIKHYKPFIVKPSSKPLTNPISPNFGAKSLTRRN